MTEMSGYPAGTPSWVDVSSPAVENAARFYAGLFGWAADAPNGAGYRLLRLRGKVVAGAGPLREPGTEPAWRTYVTVDDADKTTALAREHGATVIAEPTDMEGTGRVAGFVDPTGAPLWLWQPGAHFGAELVNEPDTLCWNELTTRDINAAKDFYRAVFGWVGDTNAYEGTTYTEWKLGDHSVGGMLQIDDDWPEEIPSQWLVYFAVVDCDATARRVEELGGSVEVAPTDIPPGRFAVITDPQGAAFSLLQPVDG